MTGLQVNKDMNYYLLRDNVHISNQWRLSSIEHCNNWHFRDPPNEFMEPGTYFSSVKKSGLPVDYSLAGYASVPIVSETFKDALVGLPEIDEPFCHVVFEPLEIKNIILEKKYFVMIIETQLNCVDECKSEFEKYEINDEIRPDLAGEYSIFYNLVIDPSMTEGKNIFRVRKHLGAIIVSEEVKYRLESAGVTGVIFESVNGDARTVA